MESAISSFKGKVKKLDYYGSTAAASKDIQCFFRDDSMEKLTQKEGLELKKQAALHPKLAVVQQNHKTLKVKNHERENHENRMEALLQALEAKFEEIEIQTKAAFKIQGAFRTHQAIRSVDTAFITKRRNSMKIRKEELKKTNFSLVFHTGYMPDLASTQIQRAIKKWLFGKKIARIARTYKFILNRKKYEAFALIRRVVHTFKSVSKVKNMKFKILRALRMEQIKERLAVLRVKKIWRECRLNIKTMRQRIRRYKRRLKRKAEEDARIAEFEEKKPEPAKLDFTSLEVEAIARVTTLEEINSPDVRAIQAPGFLESEDSEEELLREQEELQKKKKIRMGKISYNIPRGKKKEYLPSIPKKEVESAPATLEDLMKKTMEASQTFISKPKIEIPPEYEHLNTRLFDHNGQPTFSLPSKKETRIKKRRLTQLKYRYLQPTKSSNPPPLEEEPEIEEPRKPRLKSTLMNPTETHKIKRQHKLVSRSFKPNWRPNTIARDRYTLGLDNASFTPSYIPPMQRYGRNFSRPSRLYPLTSASPRTQIQTEEPVEVLNFTTPFSSTIHEALPDLSFFLSQYSPFFK